MIVAVTVGRRRHRAVHEGRSGVGGDVSSSADHGIIVVDPKTEEEQHVPKPANIERHIRDWLRSEGRDDPVAYVRCITTNVSMVSPGSSVTVSASSSDPGWAAGLLDRDLADNAVTLGYGRAFVVTPTRFLVLRLSGWKERVKATELDVDATGVLVHHVDAVQSHGHTARYVIADLPDGRWALDSMVYVKKNGHRGPFADTSDAFLHALGPRARPIPTG